MQPTNDHNQHNDHTSEAAAHFKHENKNDVYNTQCVDVYF